MALIDALGRDKLIEQRREMPLPDLKDLDDLELSEVLKTAETFIGDRYKIHADQVDTVPTERLEQIRRMEAGVRLMRQRLVMWHGMGT